MSNQSYGWSCMNGETDQNQKEVCLSWTPPQAAIGMDRESLSENRPSIWIDAQLGVCWRHDGCRRPRLLKIATACYGHWGSEVQIQNTNTKYIYKIQIRVAQVAESFGLEGSPRLVPSLYYQYKVNTSKPQLHVMDTEVLRYLASVMIKFCASSSVLTGKWLAGFHCLLLLDPRSDSCDHLALLALAEEMMKWPFLHLIIQIDLQSKIWSS